PQIAGTAHFISSCAEKKKTNSRAVLIYGLFWAPKLQDIKRNNSSKSQSASIISINEKMLSRSGDP
ncbi:MAG: hypothetical protein OEZ36_03185, partial [Spirochaetota bacterium]|nr:hypothetical protein [Spirochaetota bacterium]